MGNIPGINLLIIMKVVVFSILCAAVSILFCLVLKKIHHLYDRIPNRTAAAFMGGLIVAVLTLIVGTNDYNGAGMEVISRAVAGDAEYEAFILPTLFVGATFGNVAGKLLGLGGSFGAGLGMAALFCGVTNCPLTSIILSVELFGAEGLIYYAAACAVAYRLSGYYGLYSAQKIVYSKHRPEFIDKKAL